MGESLLSRRNVLLSAASTGALASGVLAARAVKQPAPAGLLAEYPTTPPSRASEFVGACHNQLDRVREMLAEDAGLAKASWDWGFGDWESAIGAASHTGRRDIVEILLAHGARPTHFTLATLDQTDALRAVLDALPSLRTVEGPHSISLAAHAQAGKSARTLEYLASIGLGPTTPFLTEASAVTVYPGDYAHESGEILRVEWKERLSCLALTRAGGVSRNLMPIAPHAFSPAGARHVVVRFLVSDALASSLEITGAGPDILARRVAGG